MNDIPISWRISLALFVMAMLLGTGDLLAQKTSACSIQTSVADEIQACILSETDLSDRKLSSGNHGIIPKEKRTPSGTVARGRVEASLSGYVLDATSGETLILANVVLLGTQIGAATNNAGYYTITGLDPGDYTVVASYIGYQEQRLDLTLASDENRQLDIELQPEGLFIDEVVVTAERELEEEVRRVGVAQLSVEQIRQAPAILEPDVFRSLQLLPGVKAASDYSSGLYIRGGGPDQTLILMDRTTVYNPTHFFGFFSTFNPDAIKDVRLYKGGYPAEYGGRLGSVVDVYNKDGNRKEMHGGFTLGLLASRANIEGPYSKGSYMLAVRRSTLEPLLAAARKGDVEGIPDSFYFYDVNGKLNFDASRSNRLSLSFYAGRDKLLVPFAEDGVFDIGYGNTTISLNWTHLFSQTLFSNFTFTSSRYFSVPEFRAGGTAFERDNKVYDVSAKGDFEYIPNERHNLEAGFWAGNFTFRLVDTFDNQNILDERIQSRYASLYGQYTYRPSPRWMLMGGLRGNYFQQGNYFRLEPRLMAEYRPGLGVRFQAGYGRYYQFLTLITNEVFTAFDTWLTTDRGVPPAYGDQFVMGIKTNPRPGLNLDVDLFYRTMEDLFELDPFLPDAAGLEYANLFQYGTGFAYGVEVLLQRSVGRLNGFIGYTFGNTRRRFPNLNDFEYYSPKYDRTHDLNVVMNFEISRSWRFSSVFTYATGQAYTEPASQFRLVDNPFGTEDADVLVSPFNRARLPAYHRLDVGFSNRGRFFGFADYELLLQAINVYFRRNIWFYAFSFDSDGDVNREEVPQIPILVPNISFTLRF